MVAYNLSHLTQDDTESVVGPIQDTEALFLYSIVRGMRLRRILEIGGLNGYSATNFLEAFAEPEKSVMYTVDINEVRKLAPNHKVMQKNALELTEEDLDNTPLDLIFFDCHEFAVQVTVFNLLVEKQLINNKTIIALHDTNTHPSQFVPWAYPTEDGWVHQKVERAMVNELVKFGYQAFSLHTQLNRHDEKMPFRHGVTIMQMFKPLIV
jgi:predicted O-methyltransferase YrrM